LNKKVSNLNTGSKAVGISRKWYPNGQIAEEVEFDENGEMVMLRRWNEDGSPAPVRQRALNGEPSRETH